ncbi:MAG TPA: heme ABC exporter ATP-binding protein CcmA [Rhizomicrobium sp.]|jgi:heme exporter protein A
MTLRSLLAENLTCIRGGRLVFRDVGFRVEAEQALSLEGPNGAGKSSLLRMIAGFLAPAAGAIRLRDGDAEISDSEERGNFIGWLGHHDAAKPQLTPRETLRFFADLYSTTANIDVALEEVGLSRARDLPCQYLSAGQKKRLALARLKLSNRPLWLLDEPLAALDTAGKALAAHFIQSHCASGGIAIAATHELLGVECPRLALA